MAALAAAAEREGDPGALAPVGHHGAMAEAEPPGGLSAILVRRATLTRQWQLLLDRHAALLLPVSGELPFPDGLDLGGEAAFRRMWEAQMPQIGLPLVGLPALMASTGLVGAVSVEVQLVAGRDREDLCLLAGEAIEADGVPPSPSTPRDAGGDRIGCGKVLPSAAPRRPSRDEDRPPWHATTTSPSPTTTCLGARSTPRPRPCCGWRRATP